MTNEEPMSSTLRTVIPTLIALLAGYGLDADGQYAARHPAERARRH